MNIRNQYPDDHDFSSNSRDMLHDQFDVEGDDLENLFQDYLEDPFDLPPSKIHLRNTFNKIPSKKAGKIRSKNISHEPVMKDWS